MLEYCKNWRRRAGQDCEHGSCPKDTGRVQRTRVVFMAWSKSAYLTRLCLTYCIVSCVPGMRPLRLTLTPHDMHWFEMAKVSLEALQLSENFAYFVEFFWLSCPINQKARKLASNYKKAYNQGSLKRPSIPIHNVTVETGAQDLRSVLEFVSTPENSNVGAEFVESIPDNTSAAVTGAAVDVFAFVFAVVVLAVRLELSLLEFCELDDFRTVVSEEGLLISCSATHNAGISKPVVRALDGGGAVSNMIGCELVFQVRDLDSNMIDKFAKLVMTRKGEGICWTKLIPLKIRCWVWRASTGRIAVADTLGARGITNINPTCQLCGTEPQTVDHLLATCEFSREIWRSSIRAKFPSMNRVLGSVHSVGWKLNWMWVRTTCTEAEPEVFQIQRSGFIRLSATLCNLLCQRYLVLHLPRFSFLLHNISRLCITPVLNRTSYCDGRLLKGIKDVGPTSFLLGETLAARRREDGAGAWRRLRGGVGGRYAKKRVQFTTLSVPLLKANKRASSPMANVG
ncbi:hypothetical protein LXL04_030564 [Taraxacum kok-saghyz]